MSCQEVLLVEGGKGVESVTMWQRVVEAYVGQDCFIINQFPSPHDFSISSVAIRTPDYNLRNWEKGGIFWRGYSREDPKCSALRPRDAFGGWSCVILALNASVLNPIFLIIFSLDASSYSECVVWLVNASWGRKASLKLFRVPQQTHNWRGTLLQVCRQMEGRRG
jgi:hypothetical protein